MDSAETFRQVDEKHVSSEIECMQWSPKIDLVALSNSQGEVVMHRLSWQRVWTLQAPGEGDKVGGIAWRPDGKVLAVGYRSGRVRLVNIENAAVLHSMEVLGEVTSVSWVAHLLPGGQRWTPHPYPEDDSADFMPKLQPLNKSYGTVNKGQHDEIVEDTKRLSNQEELNLLLVGTSREEVHIFSYGIFPTASLSAACPDGSKMQRILSANMSMDMHVLSVVVETSQEGQRETDYYVVTFDTMLIASRHKEIRLLALRYGQIATLLEYLQTTIQQMSEAWEDILMEMDSKLLKFAEDKRKSFMGTVYNDFLELLLFGNPSDELESFLLHELTEKGLKKLGHSIETSYSNIQKLVVKHLQTVSQALVHHLSEVRGMSQWFERFGVLGLNHQSLQAAVTVAGSFTLSTSQLQQVIDGSIKNFKAFFCWLYVEILRLSNEPPPAELSKMTQHDINFVAEFLRDNFAQFSPSPQDESTASASGEKSDATPGFKLEKVGQYLKKEDLPYPPDLTNNPWIQFQQASPSITKDSTVLYPLHSNKSLIQLQEMLETAIRDALHHPCMIMSQYIHRVSTHHLYQLTRQGMYGARPPAFCQYSDLATNQLYTVFTGSHPPCPQAFVLRHPTDPSRVQEGSEVLALKFGSLTAQTDPGPSQAEGYSVLDIRVWDAATLSLLLLEMGQDGRPLLVQLPHSVLASATFRPLPAPPPPIHPHPPAREAPSPRLIDFCQGPPLDVLPQLPGGSVCHLNNMQAHSFAVSGTRKTAIVLFSSRRRVRILMMEADDDDEDGDEDDDEANESKASEGAAAEGGSQPMEQGDENRENAVSP